MSLKARFKSQFADKHLAPIREQIIQKFSSEDRVLDVGCGTGDLLFKAAGQLSYGLGVDLDAGMIAYAKNKKLNLGIENVAFTQGNVLDIRSELAVTFDVATTTLTLHEMASRMAIDVLRMMAEVSHKVLVIDFTDTNTFSGKWGIEIDELLSGHYAQFTAYRSAGGLPFIAGTAGLQIVSKWDMPFDGIRMWEIAGVES